MINFNKPLKILLGVLLGIGLVLFVMMFLGGNEPNVDPEAPDVPNFLTSFINWGIFLTIGAALLTLLFEVLKIVMQPKKAFRTVISLGVMIVLGLIALALADSTPLNIIGYEGTDNVRGMLILSDIFIFTAYLVFGISIILVLYVEIARGFRKN
ncbi:MAG: hypothetical protein FWH18_02655 [Marinilabiliaceae bacterium]|nr:hypothetical protein [Marinilabiliaceae bacterium]